MGDGPSDVAALEEQVVQRISQQLAALEGRLADRLDAAVAAAATLQRRSPQLAAVQVISSSPAARIPAETAEACRDGGAAVDNTFDGGADIDEVSALAVAAASGVGQAFAHGSGDAESAPVFEGESSFGNMV